VFSATVLPPLQGFFQIAGKRSGVSSVPMYYP
jgi:hypothetical protein